MRIKDQTTRLAAREFLNVSRYDNGKNGDELDNAIKTRFNLNEFGMLRAGLEAFSMKGDEGKRELEIELPNNPVLLEVGKTLIDGVVLGYKTKTVIENGPKVILEMLTRKG